MKQVVVYTLLTFILAACASREETVHESDWPETFGLGRTATQGEIDSVDFDVRPDGKGLPAGEGNAIEGRVVYRAKCIVCHGPTGAEGPYAKLVAVEGGKEKVIGNYWPYATTLFDYIQRSMPYDKPGSLTHQEAYQLTAFLLSQNGLIDSTVRLDAKSLPLVDMPAKSLFVVDNRRGGAEVR